MGKSPGSLRCGAVNSGVFVPARRCVKSPGTSNVKDRPVGKETLEFGISNMLGRSSLETVLLTAEGGAEAG